MHKPANAISCAHFCQNFSYFVHSFFASKNLLMRYYFFEKLAIVVNLNVFFMNM